LRYLGIAQPMSRQRGKGRECKRAGHDCLARQVSPGAYLFFYNAPKNNMPHKYLYLKRFSLKKRQENDTLLAQQDKHF
jgi:hypothetical protein